MVITKPAVVRAWLLELGSKQYAYNMQRMLNKDLAQFILKFFLSTYVKIKQVKERLFWLGAHIDTTSFKICI